MHCRASFWLCFWLTTYNGLRVRTNSECTCGHVHHPNLTQIILIIHVHQWESSDQWFYGTVAGIKTDQSGKRQYAVLFDDGDVQTNIARDDMQFLERPDVGSIPESTRELIAVIKVGVCDDPQNSFTVVDLIREKCADPERAEVFGSSDLCYLFKSWFIM